MTSKEFVIWFKGFIDGAHNFNITPAQWDLLKEKVKEVNDDEDFFDYKPNEVVSTSTGANKIWITNNTASSPDKKELLND
jgi:hypothetical protein